MNMCKIAIVTKCYQVYNFERRNGDNHVHKRQALVLPVRRGGTWRSVSCALSGRGAALGWIPPRRRPPRRAWAQSTLSCGISSRWRPRSSASSSWCTRWRNFAGRSVWTSLDQSWTVGLRPVSWIALSASLIQAGSSWNDWSRRRNPGQASQKAFLTDLSITSLEKEGSWRNEE